MNPIMRKTFLILAGFVLVVIGSYIGLAPDLYFASFNAGALPPTSFQSELRGMGGGLMVFGVLALFAARVERIELTALTAVTLVFAAFACFRVISLVIDGLPDAAVLLALAIEALFAAVGLYLLRLLARRSIGPVAEQISDETLVAE
ncbi:MAG: hypothetical protein PsegKO_24120 [Pseudohongiellaceae bacterium]